MLVDNFDKVKYLLYYGKEIARKFTRQYINLVRSPHETLPRKQHKAIPGLARAERKFPRAGLSAIRASGSVQWQRGAADC